MKQGKRIARLKQQIDRHPDMKVSLVDSTNAGNCEYGTRAFAEKFFPESAEIGVVTLAQLKPYLPHEEWGENVCMAVIYKLRQIGALAQAEEI